MRKVNLTNGDTGVRSHTQPTESWLDHIKFDRCCLEQADFLHMPLKAALQLRYLVLLFDDLLHLSSQTEKISSTALMLASLSQCELLISKFLTSTLQIEESSLYPKQLLQWTVEGMCLGPQDQPIFSSCLWGHSHQVLQDTPHSSILKE